MTKVTINDNNQSKTFEITKMKSTACDSFTCLAMQCLIKDEVKFPEELLGADIRQVVQNLMQSGRVEEGGNGDSAKILKNIVGIFRSAFSNLSEYDRVILLDKLLSTAVYENGILKYPMSYAECDTHIDNFMTIYKLAWEVIKVNFPLLSAVKE